MNSCSFQSSPQSGDFDLSESAGRGCHFSRVVISGWKKISGGNLGRLDRSYFKAIVYAIMLKLFEKSEYFLRVRTFFYSRRLITPKQKLKGYVFPEIKKEDCEQKYISGWGPGGQKVNKAQNAVMLKHIPTGITVKVHESRLLPENVEIAFERLKLAVDRTLNGLNCYEEQLAKLERERKERNDRKKAAARKIKEALKVAAVDSSNSSK